MDVRYSNLGDMTSLGENGLNIITNANPKMGQKQASGEVSVLWLASRTHCQMFFGNLQEFGNQVKVGIRVTRSRLVTSLISGVYNCIWSGPRMTSNNLERETSYCLMRSPYRP